ncbi:aromatic amino acid DMT transporter YddG [Aeromonas simiae]|uniref:aromatic amino acid DMT transporter YddG n=1 Tax=Aeromonas simiae TaxID=218936 RepID=UPI00266C7385|nr:aromatic amino acid DMT transporter YddG [Aeromonas simiae]MDO2947117.1 aromatic amino acid DMT transporter YddG [Aeromonas simiae]MDO2950729.1 aromatic amino acid DMT transporter YddG [Aeromonas simiae]MDO2954289.1 aromatic amino acid DMT transporter YddG [Aeromonas simiae]
MNHPLPAPRRATLIGMGAILMWSASVGLFRSIAELFGAAGGAALVFTTSALLATLALGWPRLRAIPLPYLLLGGTLFVAYEVALALALGWAHDRPQALELGMINYLWPSLTVLLAVLTRQQRASRLLLPGLALCLTGIIWVMKGERAWSPAQLWHNLLQNPSAYLLAGAAALLWACYSLVTRRWGSREPVIPLFLAVTAALLWGHYLGSDEPPLPLHLPGLGQVLLLGGLTAAAYSCWNHGVLAGNLTQLAAFSYFTPVLSMALASLWLGVAPGGGFFAGVAMVTAGSLLCWWATRR